MADRRVTQTRKNQDHDITHLCNPSADWTPRKKADAISDIKNNRHRYYVKVGEHETTVKVVNHPKHGEYLTTGADASKANNLDNLPDCD